MPATLPLSKNHHGPFYMLLAMFILCLVNAIAKDTIVKYPVPEILFFRFLGAILPSWILLRRDGGIAILSNYSLGLSIIGSLILVAELLCLFISFKYLPFADATTLSFTSILLVTTLSAIFLKEKLGVTSICAILGGFVGVVIIAKPSGDISPLGVLFSLSFALGDAIVLILIRVLTRTSKSSAVTFMLTLFSTLFTAIFLPFVWQSPSLIDLLKFIFLGIGGGIGQFFITQAYRHAPAAIVAPMVYSAAIWSTLLGVLIWAEVPGIRFWIGSTFIIVAGLYIICYQQR